MGRTEMIYLPHPTFNFEKASKGGIVGLVPIGSKGSRLYHKSGYSIWNVDVKKIISKFKKARSGYWEGRHFKHPDTTYCFLREDGFEFAVRFIRADKKWDILGYWHAPQGVVAWHVREFKLWLESI